MSLITSQSLFAETLANLRSQMSTAPIPEGFADWQHLRKSALRYLETAKLPTTQDEDWRFFDLKALCQQSFHVATTQTGAVERIPGLGEPLVFSNGFAQTTSLELGQGVYVGSLRRLPTPQRSRIFEYLNQQPGAQTIFRAFNSAGFSDVAVVWLSANTVLETPVHIYFQGDSDENAQFIQPRTLVIAETGSKATLVEHYVSKSDKAPLWTNTVTEIVLGSNAEINHVRWQQEAVANFHLGLSLITQERDSRYRGTTLDLGGRLARHDYQIFPTGPQTLTELNGLVVATGEQVSDLHSLISLTEPHASTDQLHKCVVADRARTVFNGKVLVPQAAQFTNAAQLNRNLLLSPKARVDTKPELQITADNVKCTHGATVSQLEANEIFYLLSRGLDEMAARQLLLSAFIAEILQRLPVPELRPILETAISEKISQISA